MILSIPFEMVGLGLEKTVNLWLRSLPPDWDEHLDLGNNDLSMLTAFHLTRDRNAKLNVIVMNQSHLRPPPQNVGNLRIHAARIHIEGIVDGYPGRVQIDSNTGGRFDTRSVASYPTMPYIAAVALVLGAVGIIHIRVGSP